MKKYLLCYLLIVGFPVSSGVFEDYRTGGSHLNAKDFDAASEYFKKSLDQCDNVEFCEDVKVNILANLGLSLYSAGKFAKSIEYLERAYKLKPDDLRVIHMLAGGYLKAARYDESILYFSKLIELDSQETSNYVDISSVYKLKYDYFKSKEFLDKALILDPVNERALRNLLTIYGDSLSPFYDLNKSVNLAFKIYDRNKSLKNKLTYLSYLSTVNTRKEEALIELNVLLNSNELANATQRDYFNVGVIFLRQGSIDKAVKYFDKSLPDTAFFLNNYSELEKYNKNPKIVELTNKVSRILNGI